MRLVGRFHTVCMVLVSAFCFTAHPVGAQAKTAQQEGPAGYEGLINVKECIGVEVTQCELAKNLILTLKMGEDLTCEACFIQLKALGIAPGEDWSYDDPHRVVTMEEMKEVVLEVHGAYNAGTVRLDGFEAAADINRFCRDIKGPAATPVPSEQEEQKTDKPSTDPSMKPDEPGPAPSAPSEGTDQPKTPPPADTQESDTPKVAGR